MPDLYIITQGENKHSVAYRVTTVVRERIDFQGGDIITTRWISAAKYVEAPVDVVFQAESKGEAVVLRIEGTRGVAALPGFEKDLKEFP